MDMTDMTMMGSVYKSHFEMFYEILGCTKEQKENFLALCENADKMSEATNNAKKEFKNMHKEFAEAFDNKDLSAMLSLNSKLFEKMTEIDMLSALNITMVEQISSVLRKDLLLDTGLEDIFNK